MRTVKWQMPTGLVGHQPEPAAWRIILADHYLDEIQRKPGQLEIESQNAEKHLTRRSWHAQQTAAMMLAHSPAGQSGRESQISFCEGPSAPLALLYLPTREDF